MIFTNFRNGMARLGALVCCLLLSLAAQAQLYNTQKRVTVYASRFEEAKSRVNDFIRDRASRIQKKDESQERYSAEFIIPENRLPELDQLLPKLGTVTENNLNSQNLEQRVRQTRDNIADEEENLQKLSKQLALPGLEPTQKQSLQSRFDNSEANLKRQRQELRNFEGYDSLAFVTVSIFDEVTYPTGNHRISLVNMPGLEYGLLRVENPTRGVSPDYYQGYAIKYLFTRGKSYFDLGVYKARQAAPSDSTHFSELFLINFGQDFYPRHFGRGRRKSLNMYTCYQVGGFIARRANAQDSDFIPNANVGLGLELLKTKHLLIDNKVTYFLPLHTTNHDLRGLLYNASLNFVF